MSLRRRLSTGFSRAANHLLRLGAGVQHTIGATLAPDAATTMEKLDAALHTMSHGHPVAGLADMRETIAGIG